MRDDLVSASEIAEYVYCQRAWWLRRQGAASANWSEMEAGAREHDALARQLARLQRLRLLALRLLVAGVVLLLLLLVLKASS